MFPDCADNFSPKRGKLVFISDISKLRYQRLYKKIRVIRLVLQKCVSGYENVGVCFILRIGFARWLV